MANILDLLKQKGLSLDEARSAMGMSPGTNFDMLGNYVPTEDPMPEPAPLLAPMAKPVPAEPQIYREDYDPSVDLDIERGQTPAMVPPPVAAVKKPAVQLAKPAVPQVDQATMGDAIPSAELPQDVKKADPLEEQYAKEDADAKAQQEAEMAPSAEPVAQEPTPMSLNERFRRAQEARATAEDTAMWSKLGARLGGAIAKASPDVVKSNEDLADMLAKRGSRPMQQLQEQMEFQAKDPDSEYSKSAREFLKSKFNVTIPEGVSIEQLNGTMMKPLLESFKQSAGFQKEMMKQAEANKRNELSNTTRKEIGDKTLAQRALLHKDSLGLMGKRMGLQEQSLGDRNTRALNSNLQQVSQQLNNPNNRYNQQMNRADNMFSTVGLDPDIDINKLNDKDLTKQLDEQGRTLVIETAMEGAGLLTGGKPAVSTLQKLLPDNIKNRETIIQDFLNGKLNPAQQAPFIKAMLNVAHRVKEQNKAYLAKQAKESLEPLKEMIESTNNPALKQRYDQMVGYHNKPAASSKKEEKTATKNDDAAAIEWAQENPDDPDAQEILRLHGL